MIVVKIELNQDEMYPETENIIRAIVKDAFGRYVTFDPNRVEVTHVPEAPKTEAPQS